MLSKQYVVSQSWQLSRSQYVHIDIELTERCNNACIHCLINQPPNAPHLISREMDTAWVKEILTQAADLGCLTVRFTGGEPLLRPDFPELYVFARRLGLYVILFTNARLITPKMAALLTRYPPGRPVEVSVYGMHAESYDAVAASPGAFDEFWQGINCLRQSNISLIVKQSLLPPNRREQLEFEAFAAGLPGMIHCPGYTMNFELRSRRDNPAKNRLIQSLRLTPEETVQQLSHNPGYVKNMQAFAAKFMRPPGDKLFTCGAGLGLAVDAYGNALMCMGLHHPDLSYPLNAQNHGALRTAVSEQFPIWREMQATNPDYLRRCACCFLKGLCEQCPSKSWQEHGTLDTPVEYYCQVAHAQARYLNLLTEHENAWELEPAVWRQRLKSFTTSSSES